MIYYYPNVSSDVWAIRIALGLQVGGALGNLIDRLTMSYVVTDFISIGNFAVFNIADASITIGVILLIFTMWFRERENSSTEDDPSLETKSTTTGGITNPGQED
jgi:signal peptidase II